MPRFFILWTLHKIEGIMFKYKNSSKLNIMIEVNKVLKCIKPNELIESSYPINNKFLIEIFDIPIKKEIKKSIKYSKEEGNLNDS